MTSQGERPSIGAPMIHAARPVRPEPKNPLGRGRAPADLRRQTARRDGPRARPTTRALYLGLLAVVLIASSLYTHSAPLMVLGALVLSLLWAAWFSALLSIGGLERARVIVTGPEGPLPLPRGQTGAFASRPGLNVALGRATPMTARIVLPAEVRPAALVLTPRGSDTLKIERTPPPAREAHTSDPASPRGQALPLRGLGDPVLEETFSVTATRLGQGFVHGFTVKAEVALGLVSVSAWVRSEVVYRAVPERILSRPPDLQATRAVESQSDLVQRDKRGFGMEIRELRDFAPGDPFKHIAWRASARRGKLVSREFESERSLSVWLALDVSPSMWWGPPGKARIDHALSLACELTRSLAGGRDKVGLIVHDHESRLIIEPGRGPIQLARMLDALLEVPHLTLEDLTEVTDRELIAQVLRWFEVQERRVFSRVQGKLGRRTDSRPLPRQNPVDTALLANACREILGERKRRLIPISDYAVDPELAVLRVFCREVGIPLPPDPTPRPAGQAQGLEAVLGSVLMPHTGKKSSAHTIVMLTDLMTADDPEALKRVALTARRHRHGLVFVQPVGERSEFGGPVRARRGVPNPAELARVLLDIQELRAEETRRTAQALLKPAGASFVTMAPGESLARVLARLEALA